MENKRFISIDIIKGIAMIMVILVHYQQSFGICKQFDYLQMGCPIFFVASGFGIICLINKKYSGKLDKTNVAKFYFSRFKALAPGWYLAIITVFLVNTATIIFFKSTLNFGTNRDFISILCNFLFLNGLLPFCNNNVMAGGWYIGATALLYLLTPFILCTKNKFNNRKIFFIFSSALMVVIWYISYSVFHLIGYFSFAVHYPEYLLGIMLYYDLSDSMLNEKQVKVCLPLGLFGFAVAFVLFFTNIPFSVYLSAWMTALATYLVLYHMIFNEVQGKNRNNIFTKVLSDYGKNSYCIFLTHAFFAWTFIQGINLISGKFGFDIHNYFCLFAFIPIVLTLSYYSGIVMRIIVKFITNHLFCKT